MCVFEPSVQLCTNFFFPNVCAWQVSGLREEFPNLPIHVHTHDTAGTGVASMIACADVSARVVCLVIFHLSFAMLFFRVYCRFFYRVCVYHVVYHPAL